METANVLKIFKNLIFRKIQMMFPKHKIKFKITKHYLIKEKTKKNYLIQIDSQFLSVKHNRLTIYLIKIILI